MAVMEAIDAMYFPMRTDDEVDYAGEFGAGWNEALDGVKRTITANIDWDAAKRKLREYAPRSFVTEHDDDIDEAIFYIVYGAIGILK